MKGGGPGEGPPLSYVGLRRTGADPKRAGAGLWPQGTGSWPHGQADVPQPAPLDLDRFTEGLRRQLYDRVVRIQFSPPDSGFPYTPDEAGLQVVCLCGRYADSRIMPSKLGAFAVSL